VAFRSITTARCRPGPAGSTPQASRAGCCARQAVGRRARAASRDTGGLAASRRLPRARRGRAGRAPRQSRTGVVPAPRQRPTSRPRRAELRATGMGGPAGAATSRRGLGHAEARTRARAPERRPERGGAARRDGAGGLRAVAWRTRGEGGTAHTVSWPRAMPTRAGGRAVVASQAGWGRGPRRGREPAGPPRRRAERARPRRGGGAGAV
jgi:hypothetical protein